MNIFWFRRDLRLGDNRALSDLAKFEECGAVYIHDASLQSQDDFSSLHRDFIDESLNDLSKIFIDCGGFLNIYKYILVLMLIANLYFKFYLKYKMGLQFL